MTRVQEALVKALEERANEVAQRLAEQRQVIADIRAESFDDTADVFAMAFFPEVFGRGN